jgi:hypothetical protein
MRVLRRLAVLLGALTAGLNPGLPSWAITFDGMVNGTGIEPGDDTESVLIVSSPAESGPGGASWEAEIFGVPATDEPLALSCATEMMDPVSTSAGRGRPGRWAGDRWALEVDALLLWQGNTASRPLLVDGAGQTVLDANEAGTITSAGPRYRIQFDVDACHAVEGIYFKAEDFRGDATSAGGTPVGLPVTSSLMPATLLTEARFQSAELNWRRYNGGRISWLMGFRWVEWAQQMQLTGDTQGGVRGVSSLAGNDLYGSQVGADLLLWNSGPRFRVNGIGKAGIFGNRGYQRVSGIPGGGPAAADGSQVSFFGETSLVADVGITRWLTWRSGYVVFWGAGLALPAENLSLVNFGPPASAQIDMTESLLVHGVLTGLEARW